MDNSRVKRLFVSGLTLTNFRNHESSRISLSSKPVVITGENGAGKTNILEAVSLLSPGKGLRNSKLELLERFHDGKSLNWGVHAKIVFSDEEFTISTGKNTSNLRSKRITKIDGEPIKNQAELARISSVMWLTPQMDGLFIGSSSDRRKFLDRLVYNFDPDHASRVYSYEYSMRERAKLLQKNSDPAWISVLEQKMAEKSISIAVARREAVNMIEQAIAQAPSEFPKAIISVKGVVEDLLDGCSALEAERRLLEQFKENRFIDANSGRTNSGAHKSDFVVIHQEKSMPASSCSTGEQKALLLSIILAEARAKAIWKQSVPILLLDEVVAHLDDSRRMALFEELLSLKIQFWLTGTDEKLFEELSGKAQFLSVMNGSVKVNTKEHEKLVM